MGEILYSAIVVTSYVEKHLARAHAKALELGLLCTDIQNSTGINGVKSFLICPEGSKVGWEEQMIYQDLRILWKEWVIQESVIDYDDLPVEEWNNCLSVNWVHLEFHSDPSIPARIIDEHSRYTK